MSSDAEISENEEMEVEDKDEDPDEDDSASSMEDSDDEENVLIKNYIETLKKIEENKYIYEDYAQLVEIAHSLKDLDKIRESCEIFAIVYPLSPETWLRWLRIEANLASSDEEIGNVRKLFDRALADYFSVDVAYEYSKLAEKLPQLWPEILPKYTLTCLDGRIFQSFCDTVDKTSPEGLKMLQANYERQLKLPVTDLEKWYVDFKVLAELNKDTIKVDWETVDRRYNRAKGALQKILPFEKRLKELDPKAHHDRTKLYMEYIKECEDCLEDNFLQALHERMVADCCLNEKVWLQYLKFFELIEADDDDVESVFKATKLDTINRALRNCTWSVALYIEKMRTLEEDKSATRTDVQEAFELGIAAGFQTPEPVVELWLEYLGSLRRNTKFDDEKQVEILRKNFSLAWDNLGRAWGALADQNCEILQFWGRLEYGPLNDLVKGRELWGTVMESGDNANKSALWIEFAYLERNRSIDAARKIYRKSVASQEIDNIDSVVSTWMGFERCYGTIDSLDSCQKTCRDVIEVYRRNSIPNNNRQHKTDPPKKTQGLKRPAPSRGRDDKPSYPPPPKFEEKRMKFDENTKDVDPTKDNLTVFISNLDYNITEEEVAVLFAKDFAVTKINLIKNANGRGRGFGYVEFANEADVKKALDIDRAPLNGRPTYISSCLRDKTKREKFKFSEGKEPAKIFVKGIAEDVTKEELEDVFGAIGKLKDVRIVYHKNGKSKGIAYIEYIEEDFASKAVKKLNGKLIHDQEITVAISAPPPHQSQPKSALTLLSSFGAGRRAAVEPRGEMRPRMSFIPQSVRKNLETSSTAAIVAAAAAAINGEESVANIGAATIKKTNEDFRNLLLNNKK